MSNSPILIITGGSGSGKTMALENILGELYDSGIRVGGILAPGRYLDSGEKEFDLRLIPHEEKHFLSSRIQYSGWQTMGGFRFNPETVEMGLKHLRGLPLNKYQLYLLDEIGPFELNGLLWAPAIPDLLIQRVPMIWTVRKSLIEKVCIKWEIDNPIIISMEKGNMGESLDKIRIWLQQNIPELS